MMTTMIFSFGMIFFVPQLFLIGLWTVGKIIALRLPFLGVAFYSCLDPPSRVRAWRPTRAGVSILQAAAW